MIEWFNDLITIRQSTPSACTSFVHNRPILRANEPFPKTNYWGRWRVRLGSVVVAGDSPISQGKFTKRLKNKRFTKRWSIFRRRTLHDSESAGVHWASGPSLGSLVRNDRQR